MPRTGTGKRIRIAIFTADDNIWALPTWIATMPGLLRRYDVVGITLFPDRLAQMKGLDVYRWHLRVFGLWNVLIMGLYASRIRLKQLMSPIRSWQPLASKYGLQLNRASTPNSKTVIRWTKSHDIDIVFLMAGNILRSGIINAPNIGIINNHAAILPSCRGIFPFFWGRLRGAPTGISFHQVDRGIDTGGILTQTIYPPERSRVSMLRFYIDVFSLFPRLALLAADKLAAGEYMEPLLEVEPTYHSLPTREDYEEFRKKLHKVASCADIFYRPPADLERAIREVRGD